mgnify:CR=1 FL=1
MDVYEKLKELGLQLPPAPAKGGVYSPSKRAGNLIFISGCGPAIGGNCLHGKLGGAVSLEEGQACARDCMLNVLAVLQAAVASCCWPCLAMCPPVLPLV